MRLIFIFILIFNMAFSTEQFFNTEQSIFQNDAIQDEPAAIKQNSIAMPEEEAMPAVKEKKQLLLIGLKRFLLTLLKIKRKIFIPNMSPIPIKFISISVLTLKLKR